MAGARKRQRWNVGLILIGRHLGCHTIWLGDLEGWYALPAAIAYGVGDVTVGCPDVGALSRFEKLFPVFNLFPFYGVTVSVACFPVIGMDGVVSQGTELVRLLFSLFSCLLSAVSSLFHHRLECGTGLASGTMVAMAAWMALVKFITTSWNCVLFRRACGLGMHTSCWARS